MFDRRAAAWLRRPCFNCRHTISTCWHARNGVDKIDCAASRWRNQRWQKPNGDGAGLACDTTCRYTLVEMVIDEGLDFVSGIPHYWNTQRLPVSQDG